MLSFIAQIDNNTLIGIGTIIVGVGGLLGGFYIPLINNYRARSKLRKGLYRELVNWYETAMFHIREHNGHAANNFFTPSKLDELLLESSTNEKREVQNQAFVIVGRSILQAERNHQIWRIALIEKLIHLRDVFTQLKK